MRIVAGMGTIEEYEDYVKAGADEVFVGYVPYAWQKEQERTNPLNRREVSYSNVNLGSESELEILAKKMNRVGRPVTIAFNGLNYRPEQYLILKDIVEKCIQYSFSDFIVGDLGLLIYLQQAGLNQKVNIHISGELGEMNNYQIAFLKELGAKRIIYHRGTGKRDLKEMISAFPELEHEVFFMNEKCHFTGAYCNSLHCDEMVPMCRMPYWVEGMNNDAENVDNSEKKPSGVDSYKTLKDMGVTHIKIVGRGANTDDMIRDISTAATVRKCYNDSRECTLQGDFYELDN